LSASPNLKANDSSPDAHAAGFIEGTIDPLRYDYHVLDPDEVSGIFASMIPRSARVLDVGCGTGALTKILADSCQVEIVGVEPDRARAERAIARGLTVHAGFLTSDLGREIGTFDIALFADVLEHLPNPQSLLLAARDFLRAGGAVIVSVPNVAHWSVRAEIVRGRFRYQPLGIMDATHLRWFTAESIKSLVASAGFKVTVYRATAGVDIPDNACRRPLRWMSRAVRCRFLRSASQRWPTLFGCQHVLKAETK